MTLKKPCEFSLTQRKKPFFTESPYAKKQPIKPLTVTSPFSFPVDAFNNSKGGGGGIYSSSGISPPSRLDFTLLQQRAVAPLSVYSNDTFSMFKWQDTNCLTVVEKNVELGMDVQ